MQYLVFLWKAARASQPTPPVWCGGLLLLLLVPLLASAQPTTLAAGPYTLEQCVREALQNQPLVRQAQLDEQTNEADIRIGLSDWLPQVGLDATAQHFFELPFVVLPTPEGGLAPRRVGLRNTSTFTLGGTQVLYNNDVWLSLRRARPARQLFRQTTAVVKTNLAADVSKAFYDVLLSERQLSVLLTDLGRLQRSLQDARARYEAGVSDKIDYKQAEILLNNTLAARKQAQESIKAKSAYLRELMGLPGTAPLALQYDTLRLEQDAAADTLTALDPTARLEVQRLQTEKQLQATQISYFRWGFLPALSAFGNYNTVYQNNNLRDLYSRRFPNSVAGVQLSLPLFQGTRRLQNLRRARLVDERLDQEVVAVRNQINTEFEQALASYKGNYADFQLGRRNVALAREVYQVVDLQYREGIKPYLDVLVAQSTLRSAELNYYVALFQVLSSKVDLQRARGALNVE